MDEKQVPSLIREGRGNEVIAMLYKLIYPKVRNFISKNQGRKEDASDVFQDAILYFYKQVMEDKFNEKYTVYGYIYRLSINRWINKIKKDKKISLPGESLDVPDEEISKEYDSIEDILANRKLVEKMMEGVGEKCKEILIYSISYNLMMEDIMLRMGFVSEGAVKMQLKRCKEKLYRLVEENSPAIKLLKEG